MVTFLFCLLSFDANRVFTALLGSSISTLLAAFGAEKQKQVELGRRVGRAEGPQDGEIRMKWGRPNGSAEDYDMEERRCLKAARRT